MRRIKIFRQTLTKLIFPFTGCSQKIKFNKTKALIQKKKDKDPELWNPTKNR